MHYVRNPCMYSVFSGESMRVEKSRDKKNLTLVAI